MFFLGTVFLDKLCIYGIYVYIHGRASLTVGHSLSSSRFLFPAQRLLLVGTAEDQRPNG